MSKDRAAAINDHVKRKKGHCGSQVQNICDWTPEILVDLLPFKTVQVHSPHTPRLISSLEVNEGGSKQQQQKKDSY